jgi:phospholipid/cholesterol/gamma-HCH transport system substrate-binding protein
MRKSAANKLVLGFFVMIALALFIGAIYYMGKQRKMFGESIHLRSQFKQVGGLMVGNNVRFAGINVGTVEDISIINDSTVQVDMVIEKKVQKFIRKDSKAIIGAEGLMGNKLVNIMPGTSTAGTVEPNDIILSAKAVDFDDIIRNLEKTSQNAVTITQEVATMTQKINNGNGTLARLLNDSTYAMILENSLRNVENGTEGFHQNMEAMKSNFLFRGYYKKKERDKLKAEQDKNKTSSKEKEDDDDDNKDTSPRKKKFQFWK